MLADFRPVNYFAMNDAQQKNAPNTHHMKHTSSMPKYFEMVTVINRDIDRKRWQNIEQEFFRAGIIHYQRFKAVEGNRLTEDQVKKHVTAAAYQTIKQRVRTNHSQLSSFNQVACFLSHTTLWSQLVRSPQPYRTIAEDDIIVAPDLLYRISQSLPALPSDADIILWGDIDASRTPTSAVMPGQEWVRVRRFFGCHMYTIKREAAQKLLAKSFPMSCQLDSAIFMLADELNLKIYAHEPTLVRQGRFPSTIQIAGDCLSCGQLR